MGGQAYVSYVESTRVRETASLSRLTPANSCGVMMAAEYFSRSVVDKSSDHFYLKVATTFIYNCVLKITFFRYVSRSGPL